MMVNLVEAREINAPADVEEPIHWVLLTSWPISNFACVLRVINTSCRETVESKLS
jgi:hypothetical protein